MSDMAAQVAPFPYVLELVQFAQPAVSTGIVVSYQVPEEATHPTARIAGHDLELETLDGIEDLVEEMRTVATRLAHVIEQLHTNAVEPDTGELDLISVGLGPENTVEVVYRRPYPGFVDRRQLTGRHDVEPIGELTQDLVAAACHVITTINQEHRGAPTSIPSPTRGR